MCIRDRIGAGVGGLAGLAIGSAIGEVAGRDRAKDYCEGWLDQHRQAYAPPAAPAYGHPAPYGYAQPAGYYGAACACAPAVTYMQCSSRCRSVPSCANT